MLFFERAKLIYKCISKLVRFLIAKLSTSFMTVSQLLPNISNSTTAIQMYVSVGHFLVAKLIFKYLCLLVNLCLKF